MTTTAGPKLRPFGDSAVLIVLGDGIDDAVNRRVHALASELEELHRADPRFGHPVPAYASVLVPVDPLDPGVEAAIDAIRPLADRAAKPVPEAVDPPPGPAIDVPTRYGGVDGPDLDDVAALHGLRPADVVELHASVVYRVHFLGFAPGFAYLGTVPAEIVTPRLATPRVRVPAGSVAIAGEQTAIYPFDSPGGWRLIGRTDLCVWNLDRDPPALLLPGRRVRFVPGRG
jgi:KipI family sensor histidine kinase inhibitor